MRYSARMVGCPVLWLAGGKQCPTHCRPVTQRGNLRIESLAGMLPDIVEHGVHRPGSAIHAIRPQRVEDVGDHDQAPGKRDGFSCKSIRITVAIPLFMVGSRDLLRELHHA